MWKQQSEVEVDSRNYRRSTKRNLKRDRLHLDKFILGELLNLLRLCIAWIRVICEVECCRMVSRA